MLRNANLEIYISDFSKIKIRTGGVMIKRIISFLIISILILQFPTVILASPGQTPENLIKNGGFDTFADGAFADWGITGSSTITQETDGGRTYAKIEGRVGQNTGMRQPVSLKQGRTYIASIDLKANTTNGFTWLLESADYSFKHIVADTKLTDGEWTTLTGEVKFDDKAVENCNVAVYELSTPYTDTVCWDNFSIVPKYVIGSINVSGADVVVVPNSSTPNTADYSGAILNTLGTSTEMPEGDIITWSLKEAVTGVSISAEGKLSVESTATPGEVVTIVATATEYGVDAEGTFDVTLSEYKSDEDMVNEAIEALKTTPLTDESYTAVTHSLSSLPSTGEYGTTITWESGDDTVMSDAGVIVAEPPYGNLNVAMTATVSMNDYSDTYDFPFTILANSNFVKNPGFEESSLEPWAKEGLDAVLSGENPHSGSKCVELTNVTQSYFTLNQNVSVPNNNEYIYSVWVRVPENQGSEAASFTLGARPAGTSKNHLISVNVPANNEWTRISAPYTHPGADGEKSTVNIYLFLYTTGLEYYMDDFAVEPLKADVVNIIGQDGIRLPAPDSQSVSRKFTTDITDQLDRPLTPNTVSWSVRAKNGGSPSGISVDNDGNLTVNPEAAPQTVILSATATYNGLSSVGEKEIEILQYLDEAAAVKTALASLTEASILTGGDTSIAELRSNLSLPSSYSSVPGVTPDYVVAFEWVSDNEGVIKADGTIVRDIMADRSAALTVTARLGEKSEEKKFAVTVKRLENLLDEHDFEASSASMWSVDNSSGTLEVSADAKRTGEYGLKVSGGNASQELSRVKYGRTYHFTGYVKSSAAVGAYLKSAKGEFSLGGAAANTSAFEKIDVVFEYTGEDNPKLVIGASGAEFFMDDLQVADVTDAFAQAGEAVIKAEESRSSADKSAAADLVSKLPDCSMKDNFSNRVNNISVVSQGSGSSGSGSSGSRGSSSKTSFSAASQAAVVEVKPVKPVLADIEGHWAEAEIIFLFNKGIVNGSSDGSFYPNNNITRAEFAAMLVRMLGIPVDAYANVFSDVKAGDWYADVVQTIYNNGIMSGYAGYFRPNDKITREEMAVSVMKAYELKTKAEAEITVSEEYFKDTEAMAEWSRNSIFKAVSLELINGTGNQLFEPADYATRAQVSVLIKRLYERIGGNA